MRPSNGPERHDRRLTLLLPLAIALSAWGLVLLTSTWRHAWEVLTAVGASLVVFGPTVIFGPAVVPGLALSTWELVAVVSFMSVLTAFVYAYNLDLFERVPRVGPWLRRARMGASRSLRQHPWVRRLATVGLGVFVLLPLPGSGSLGGCLIGRLIGLRPLRTFLATGIAGVLVALLYGWGGATLKEWLDREEVGWKVRAAGVVLFLLVVTLLVRFVRRFARTVPPGADARVTAQGQRAQG
jgi:uncharacterized membrane protein